MSETTIDEGAAQQENQVTESKVFIVTSLASIYDQGDQISEIRK